MTVQHITATREQVVATIRKAAENHDVDFDYMLKQAAIESGLDPAARARTSSATGLYQFTSGTWLNVVKRHGDKVGLQQAAATLRNDTATAADRAKILSLRQEPDLSAQLAARFALDNEEALKAAGHRTIGATELYLAHFLGAGGATAFLNGLRANPDAPAATALPAAAAANAKIFYNGAAPRSYQAIYDRFARKFEAPVIGAPGPAESVKPQPLKSADGHGQEQARIKAVVSQVLASTSQEPIRAESGVRHATAPVPADTLETYLKGFSLFDHADGLTPMEREAPRDASQAAGLRNDARSERQDDLPKIGLGARLILKSASGKEMNA